MNPQKPMVVNVDFDRTKELKCGCGNATFEKVNFLREVPGLYTPNNKPAITNIEVWECRRCHKLYEFGRNEEKGRRRGTVLLRVVEKLVSLVPIFLRKK